MVAQGEVLQSHLPVAAAEEREEAEQVEQRSDHGARFSSGQGRRSIALATGRGFGEGQVLPAFVWVEVESTALEVDGDLEVLWVANPGRSP
jgi:hypothetical protein